MSEQSDLSAAIDEIYFLRAVIADEAGIIEAHLDYKTFPKTRRKIADEQIARMKRIAGGEMYAASRDRFDQSLALRRIGVPDLLTNYQWLEQRNRLPIDDDK